MAAGYDGTWVAHPDLCKLAKDIFVKGLDGKANQVDRFVEFSQCYHFLSALAYLGYSKKKESLLS